MGADDFRLRRGPARDAASVLSHGPVFRSRGAGPCHAARRGRPWDRFHRRGAALRAAFPTPTRRPASTPCASKPGIRQSCRREKRGVVETKAVTEVECEINFEKSELHFQKGEVTSHACGANSRANGQGGRACGADSRANGPNVHMDGADTRANGPNVHVDGADSRANGAEVRVDGAHSRATGPDVGVHQDNRRAEAEGFL